MCVYCVSTYAAGIMKLQLLLSIFVAVGALCVLVSCPDADFAGVNVPYPDQE